MAKVALTAPKGDSIFENRQERPLADGRIVALLPWVICADGSSCDRIRERNNARGLPLAT